MERSATPGWRSPQTAADLDAISTCTTLSYIRHLESENNRLWGEINTMRDGFTIVAQSITAEVSMTLTKANTTFDALATRMSEFLPTPFTGDITTPGETKPLWLKPLKKSSVLGKRPGTPGSDSTMSGDVETKCIEYYPHPPRPLMGRLRSRSSSLGRTFGFNTDDLMFGSPPSKDPQKRVSGWPLPKVQATPGRVSHKRSKTFHLTPNFSLPREPTAQMNSSTSSFGTPYN